MSNLEAKVAKYKEAVDIYHKACAYTKEMQEKAEQSRERQFHLRDVRDMAYKELMTEILGKDVLQHSYLMFG